LGERLGSQIDPAQSGEIVFSSDVRNGHKLWP
jgi:hypothetical protein